MLFPVNSSFIRIIQYCVIAVIALPGVTACLAKSSQWPANSALHHLDEVNEKIATAWRNTRSKSRIEFLAQDINQIVLTGGNYGINFEHPATEAEKELIFKSIIHAVKLQGQSFEQNVRKTFPLPEDPSYGDHLLGAWVAYTAADLLSRWSVERQGFIHKVPRAVWQYFKKEAETWLKGKGNFLKKLLMPSIQSLVLKVNKRDSFKTEKRGIKLIKQFLTPDFTQWYTEVEQSEDPWYEQAQELLGQLESSNEVNQYVKEGSFVTLYAIIDGEKVSVAIIKPMISGKPMLPAHRRQRPLEVESLVSKIGQLAGLGDVIVPVEPITFAYQKKGSLEKYIDNGLNHVEPTHALWAFKQGLEAQLLKPRIEVLREEIEEAVNTLTQQNIINNHTAYLCKHYANSFLTGSYAFGLTIEQAALVKEVVAVCKENILSKAPITRNIVYNLITESFPELETIRLCRNYIDPDNISKLLLYWFLTLQADMHDGNLPWVLTKEGHIKIMSLDFEDSFDWELIQGRLLKNEWALLKLPSFILLSQAQQPLSKRVLRLIKRWQKQDFIELLDQYPAVSSTAKKAFLKRFDILKSYRFEKKAIFNVLLDLWKYTPFSPLGEEEIISMAENSLFCLTTEKAGIPIQVWSILQHQSHTVS